MKDKSRLIVIAALLVAAAFGIWWMLLNWPKPPAVPVLDMKAFELQRSLVKETSIEIEDDASEIPAKDLEVIPKIEEPEHKTHKPPMRYIRTPCGCRGY